MGDARKVKYVIPEIDRNYLELDEDVGEIFLFVAIKLNLEKDGISFSPIN